MSKKKLPVKKFIAIDEYREVVICIGALDEVIEAIEEHVDYEDYAQDEVESSIKLYELGAEKSFSIYPGKLEIVVED